MRNPLNPNEQRGEGFIVVFSPGFSKSVLPLVRGEKVAGCRMSDGLKLVLTLLNC